MRANHGKGSLMLALFVASAAPGLAADSPVGTAAGDAVLVEPEPQPWGGASSTALVVGAGDITPPDNLMAWHTLANPTNGVGLYLSTVTNDWWYQVHLPAGALLQRLELEACDVTAIAGIVFGMTRGVAPAGAAANITAVATTGVAATPGCAFFSTPTAVTTINNASNNYWVFFTWSGGAGNFNSTVVHAFRIYYRLQVSPAPAVATFPNDVPSSHPFFRFVEAMAASGLTGGCGPGTFCVNDPVTRGQLSVFLASALGLHFPN